MEYVIRNSAEIEKLLLEILIGSYRRPITISFNDGTKKRILYPVMINKILYEIDNESVPSIPVKIFLNSTQVKVKDINFIIYDQDNKSPRRNFLNRIGIHIFKRSKEKNKND